MKPKNSTRVALLVLLACSGAPALAALATDSTDQDQGASQAQEADAKTKQEEQELIFSPRPPSARAALGRALEVIERRKSKSVEIRFRYINSRAQVHQVDGQDRVDVTMELEIYASDALRATEEFSGLRTAFLETSWCTAFEYEGSSTIDGGILAKRVRVSIAGRPAEAELVEKDKLRNVEVLVRTVGYDEGTLIGDIDIDINSHSLAGGWTDHIFRAQPNERSESYKLATILAFLQQIEDSSAFLRTTEINLSRPKKGKGWTFNSELTVRMRN